MKYCYVFFVITGTENRVCKFLNDSLGEDFQLSFIPKKEVIYKNTGRISIKQCPMFPSYVFSKTDCPSVEFIKETVLFIRRSSEIIRLLGMYDPPSMAMNPNEKDFMMKLCDEQFVIRKSTGLIIGDRIIVNEGPLVGFESIIKKIDRHKRRAEIELPMLGELRRISVSLEIVKKIKEA